MARHIFNKMISSSLVILILLGLHANAFREESDMYALSALSADDVSLLYFRLKKEKW